MVQQGLFSRQIFSLWLNQDPEDKELGGEIVFGGTDWRHHQGDHTYVSVADNGYWQVSKALGYEVLYLVFVLLSL